MSLINIQIPLLVKLLGRSYNAYISDLFYLCIISGFDRCYNIDSTQNRKFIEDRMNQYCYDYGKMTDAQKMAIKREIIDVFYSVSKNSIIPTAYYQGTKQNERV